MQVTSELSGFGGLGAACWHLVPKFAGSNPSDFLGRKNPQNAFLWRGSKAVGPMRHVKDPFKWGGSRHLSGELPAISRL
jgi:hypothetical protein